MTSERISELLKPFLEKPLSDRQLQSIVLYLDVLLKWNSKINLTAIRGTDEIITRHFGESLFAAALLFQPGESATAIDVGSGAGFPGIPIKLWAPNIAMTLIESNQRKATFLREVVRALGLQGTNVVAGRAETTAIQADVVTLRAVEHFDRTLPVARRLVRLGGRLAILVGERQIKIATATLFNVNWQIPIPIPGSQSRTILVGTV